MTITKHPAIIFVVEAPLDGSQDRAIAEALLAAGQFLNQHLTDEHHAALGRHERDRSGGLHLALPVDIQIRDRDLFSEMVDRADPRPDPLEARPPRGLSFLLSADDSAATMQGVAIRSSSDPSPGTKVPTVTEAAHAYKVARKAYNSASKPSRDSSREEWEAYWPIVNRMVKAKRMLELAAEQEPGESLPN